MNNKFRPIKFQDYIGQKNIINNLKVSIEAAKIKNTTLDHILLFGSSGVGKTSLAYLISNELNRKIIFLNGPALQKQSDLISCLLSIKNNEIIFIDEIHSVNKELLEILYPALEDNKISVVIGKEYNSKIVDVNLPNFTLICATTELHKIPEPLFNRLPMFFTFENYEKQDIIRILKICSKKLNIKLTNENFEYLSNFCKFNPRLAINLLKRIYDYIVSENISEVTNNYLSLILKKLSIYEYGLNKIDLSYLSILEKNKCLSIESLSQITCIPIKTLTTNLEPYLLKIGLITKTPKGRMICTKGKDILTKINN